MSIVLELQRDAMGSSVMTSELLRRAYVVARKLKLQDFGNWIELEQKGYPRGSEIPKYRRLYGDLKVNSPQRGPMPIRYSTPQLEEVFRRHATSQPISELESIMETIRRTPHAKYVISLGAEEVEFIHQHFNFDTPFPLVFVADISALEGVTQAVRSAILDWALQLEEEGILGEGLSFSLEEKKLAESQASHLTIGTIIGSMALQQNSPGATQNQNSEGTTMGDTHNYNQVQTVHHGAGNVSGNIQNINSSLDSAIQTVNASSSGPLPQDNKEELTKLLGQFKEMLQTVPAEHAQDAEFAAKKAEELVKEAAKEKPHFLSMSVSADGLKAAAKSLASVIPAVYDIAAEIVSLVQGTSAS